MIVSEGGDFMQNPANSHVLYLRGERGWKIYEQLRNLKPMSDDEIERRKDRIKKQLESQGMVFKS